MSPDEYAYLLELAKSMVTAQRRIDKLREEHGVQPGESLWQAMFGVPFGSVSPSQEKPK